MLDNTVLKQQEKENSIFLCSNMQNAPSCDRVVLEWISQLDTLHLRAYIKTVFVDWLQCRVVLLMDHLSNNITVHSLTLTKQYTFPMCACR